MDNMDIREKLIISQKSDVDPIKQVKSNTLLQESTKIKTLSSNLFSGFSKTPLLSILDLKKTVNNPENKEQMEPLIPGNGPNKLLAIQKRYFSFLTPLEQKMHLEEKTRKLTPEEAHQRLNINLDQ